MVRKTFIFGIILVLAVSSVVVHFRMGYLHGSREIQDVHDSGSKGRSRFEGTIPADSFVQSTGVLESVNHCMAATHLDTVLDSDFSVTQAIGNAQYLFDEFRKLIPEKPLDGYKSHCWSVPYFTQWSKYQYSGRVGNVSFTEDLAETKHKYLVPILTKINPEKKYHSELVCLPNVFLAGFPKCGSTFLYCFMNKLIYLGTKLSGMNAEKEPRFWAPAMTEPTVGDLGGYLLNFLPGLKSIEKQNAPQGILVDGTPNTLFRWPRFTDLEHDLTNYCLLPSIIPK